MGNWLSYLDDGVELNLKSLVASMTDQKKKKGMEEILSSISLASVLNGFKSYRLTWKMVVLHRKNFISIAAESEPKIISFGSSLSTFLYGAALCFVLYLPIIVKNELALEKVYFLLQFLYQQCYIIIGVYISAKIFFGRGTLEKTAISYLIYVGICSPIVTFLNYPIFVYVPTSDFIGLSSRSGEEWIKIASTIPSWVLIWNAIIYSLMALAFFRVLLCWLSEIHQITRKRLFVAFLFIFLPLAILRSKFVDPYMAKGIHLLSEMLGKLI